LAIACCAVIFSIDEKTKQKNLDKIKALLVAGTRAHVFCHASRSFKPCITFSSFDSIKLLKINMLRNISYKCFERKFIIFHSSFIISKVASQLALIIRIKIFYDIYHHLDILKKLAN
jgi:hypothetical protein